MSADAEVDLDAVSGPAPLPPCEATPPRWILPDTPSGDDAGSTSRYESVEVAGARVLLTDARSGRLHLRHAASDVSVALGGEHSDPRLTTLRQSGGTLAAVAWVRQSMAGRHHVVRFGDRLDRGCEHPEARDEGLSLGAASTASGLLLAWDEDGPAPAAGRILVHTVDPRTARPVGPSGVAGACPVGRPLSPPEQDASDPVAIRLGDGAAVFWLTSRDVTGGEEHNETVTDLWGQAVTRDGVGLGRPLRLTQGPGHRFGIALAAVTASTVWVAWRNAPDSDSESRGDGGEVAVARVEASAEGLVRVTRTALVHEPGDVPSGAPVVWADASGVSVWWRARREGRVVSVRRRIDGSGNPHPEGVRVEEAAGGALPWVDGNAATPGSAGSVVPVLRLGAGGGVGVVGLRCP